MWIVPLTIVAMGITVFLGVIAPAVAERIRHGPKNLGKAVDQKTKPPFGVDGSRG